MKILVCEDEPIIALDIQIVLEEAGYAVLGPVRAVSEARAFCAREMPEAALLDVSLSDGTTYDLAGDLLLAGVPVLFLSGRQVEKRASLADVPVIAKPFDAAMLLEGIARLARCARPGPAAGGAGAMFAATAARRD